MSNDRDCPNCIHRKENGCEEWDCKFEPKSDYISRQAVKEWLTRWEGYIDNDTIARMQYRVIDIPPVNPQEPKTEPKYCDRNICVSNEYNGIGCDECEVTKSQEPKTGHWIKLFNTATGLYDFICDKCNGIENNTSKYCPNCGAKMEGKA